MMPHNGATYMDMDMLENLVSGGMLAISSIILVQILRIFGETTTMGERRKNEKNEQWIL